MLRIRPRAERGYQDYGWLKSYASFSFGAYYDPAHARASVLRVLNEDWVAGGGGFSTHEHHDVEILTYMLRGRLRHEDTMGHQAELVAGDVQRISAGAGIKHSEVNTSLLEDVHLLQVWILPNEAGTPPDYAQQSMPPSERLGRFVPIASADGRDGSLRIRQDCTVLLAALEAGQEVDYSLPAGRLAYVHVVDGAVNLNGRELVAGDAVTAEDEPLLRVTAESTAEVMLFDMP